MQLEFTFGQVDALLAGLHDIASERRTQFQARLRNFQRLGIPEGVSAGRGKAALYKPPAVVELALALELAQLGLLPERIIEVYWSNKYSVLMALRDATQILLGHPALPSDDDGTPTPVFIFFDPTALAPLVKGFGEREDQAAATLYYGGIQLIHANFSKLMSGSVRRLSFINVTSLLSATVSGLSNDESILFMEELLSWIEAELSRDSKQRDWSIADAERRLNWAESDDDVRRALDQFAAATRLPKFMKEAWGNQRRPRDDDDPQA